MYQISDSDAQQGQLPIPHIPVVTPALSVPRSVPAGCSVTASTTPVVAPAIAAAPATTSSPGSLPLPTAPTSASVSAGWASPSFPSTALLWCRGAVHWAAGAGAEWDWVNWRAVTRQRGLCTAGDGVQVRLTQEILRGPCGTLALLAFQFLLCVQGFVQASLIAQLCLQDELGLDVFTYRTSLFV